VPPFEVFTYGCNYYTLHYTLHYRLHKLNMANLANGTSCSLLPFLVKLELLWCVYTGRYVLQLFVNDGTKNKNFTSVCNYLVIADVGCSDSPPFPPCDNKLSQTGDVTTERGTLKLIPVSHKVNSIDLRGHVSTYLLQNIAMLNYEEI